MKLAIIVDLHSAVPSSTLGISTIKLKEMGKLDKKKRKMQDRIDILQAELVMSLTKKSGKTCEINVGESQRKINELRLELSKM